MGPIRPRFLLLKGQVQNILGRLSVQLFQSYYSLIGFLWGGGGGKDVADKPILPLWSRIHMLSGRKHVMNSTEFVVDDKSSKEFFLLCTTTVA